MARSRFSRPVLDEIRHEHHLDESLFRQYVWWLRGIVTLDFGNSFIDHRLVTERIAEKMPNTIILSGIAFLVAALLGVPIGLWSAARSGRSSSTRPATSSITPSAWPSIGNSTPSWPTISPTPGRSRLTKWAIAKRVKNVKESKGWGLYLWHPGELDWWIPKSQQKR